MNISNDNLPPVKPRPWRRWVKRGALLLLALLALGLGWLLWRSHRVQSNLAEAVAELDRIDPGWRLEEIEAARKDIPDGQNSARVVVAAGKALPRRWWATGPFWDRLERLPPEEQLAPREAARLHVELDRVAPALEIARRLADLPRGRYQIVRRPDLVRGELVDQEWIVKVGRLLRHDSIRQAQAGDLKQALVSCRASLNVGRSVGDEPFALSQRIRLARALVTCWQVERLLAQGEPPPEEMRRLQIALGEEDAHPGLLIALRGKRAVAHAVFCLIESGDLYTSAVLGGSPGWRERWLGPIFRHEIRAEHPFMLALMNRRIRDARLPLPQQAKSEGVLMAKVRSLRRQAPLTWEFLNAPPRLTADFLREHARLRCAETALGCERYRHAKGSWPKELADLVPGYLDVVPADPYDGKPLRLARLADGLVVYSVGPDGSDDGGKLNRNNPIQPGTDLGFRLWDVASRRQPPPPPPPE